MAVATGVRWQAATVLAVRDETARAKTFRLALEHPIAHVPGQHYAIRLTAADGYTATRSYSVASAPEPSGEIELTVDRLDHGEVSGFLHDEVRPGDELEVRGPLGGWFVWDGGAPALLLGGGSGVVPLMAMLRHARATGRADAVHLVVSVRSADDLLYADEIHGPETSVLYTRHAPPGHRRAVGRMTSADLPRDLDPGLDVYVCGSVGFTTHATDLLVGERFRADRIRVELFGPGA